MYSTMVIRMSWYVLLVFELIRAKVGRPTQLRALANHVDESVAEAAGIFEVDGQVNEIIFRGETLLIQQSHNLRGKKHIANSWC